MGGIAVRTFCDSVGASVSVIPESRTGVDAHGAAPDCWPMLSSLLHNFFRDNDTVGYPNVAPSVPMLVFLARSADAEKFAREHLIKGAEGKAKIEFAPTVQGGGDSTLLFEVPGIFPTLPFQLRQTD